MLEPRAGASCWSLVLDACPAVSFKSCDLEEAGYSYTRSGFPYWQNMGVTGRRKGKAEEPQEVVSEPESNLQQVVVNGEAKVNGMVGKLHQSIEKENIFLFIPNVIGMLSLCLYALPLTHHALQAIPASSSPLPLYTTCHFIRGHVLSSIQYPAFSTRSMVSLLDDITSLPPSERFWTW